MRLGEASEEPAISSDSSHSRTHLRDELAVLEDLLSDQRFGFTFDQVREAEQASGSLARQATRPAPVCECVECSLDRGIYVRDVGIGHAAPIGLSIGIVRGEARPTLRGAPFAIDEEGKAGCRPATRARLKDRLSTHWLTYLPPAGIAKC